ncbi:MAG: hypothetical protein ABI567_08085 [Gammaproteobacteria bacterium]
MQHPVRSPLLVILGLLGLALAGGLLLPIAGYLAGKQLIGAYEGRLGLSDYLGSIYAAAGHGELLAWWLLLAPALLVLLCFLALRLDRRLRARPDDD